MTVAAQAIIKDAQIALNDPDGVRWSAEELVSHLNAGQITLVRLRPDQKAKTVAVTLSSGFRQNVPSDMFDFIDIPSNATGKRKRVTKTDLALLDMIDPAWRSTTESSEIVHFVYDLREPLVFLTYPPAKAGASVDMTYSTKPALVPSPSGASWTSVTGNIDVQDPWQEALLNFVLHKAYNKDVEFGGNAQVSASYYALFNEAVGTQLQSAATVAPKT